MAEMLRQMQEGRVCLIALVVLGVSGCATLPAQVTLVNPKTEKSVVCPDGLFVPLTMSNEQAAQQRAWHAEFQRTQNRLPTPMEGCVRQYEILGYVRKPQ